MHRLDLHAESAIPFSEVPNLIPRRRGKKVHYSTVYRWATKGVRGRVLPSRLVGGIRYTTVAELNQFLEASRQTSEDAQTAAALERMLYSGKRR